MPCPFSEQVAVDISN